MGAQELLQWVRRLNGLNYDVYENMYHLGGLEQLRRVWLKHAQTRRRERAQLSRGGLYGPLRAESPQPTSYRSTLY